MSRDIHQWYGGSVKFSQNWNAGEDVLRCPSCGFDYLHHGAVRLYDREEDQDDTVVTTVDNGCTHVETRPSNKTRNPSMRRHGLAIAFDCEGCNALLELTFAQHKGVTLVGWRYQPEGNQKDPEISMRGELAPEPDLRPLHPATGAGFEP